VLNIIDVEASGLQSGSYPVEVGIAFANGERLSMLIQPEPEWVHWDLQAQRLHGISRRTLSQYGKPAGVERHRASHDAWLIQQTYERSLKKAESNQL